MILCKSKESNGALLTSTHQHSSRTVSKHFIDAPEVVQQDTLSHKYTGAPAGQLPESDPLDSDEQSESEGEQDDNSEYEQPIDPSYQIAKYLIGTLNQETLSERDKNLIRIFEDEVVSYILNELQPIIIPTSPSTVRSHTNASSSSGSGGQSPSSRAQKNGGNAGSQANNLKRHRSNDDESGKDGGKDGQELSKFPPHLGSNPQTRHLACPFFRNNPDKYRSLPSCIGHRWITVHRVK